jgi:hypothetical protein
MFNVESSRVVVVVVVAQLLDRSNRHHQQHQQQLTITIITTTTNSVIIKMGCANSKTTADIATISGGGKNKGIVDNANDLLGISPPVGSPSTENSTITRGSDGGGSSGSHFFTPMSDNTFRTCYSHATASSIISTGKGREKAAPKKEGEEEEQQEAAGQAFNLFDDDEDIQADNVEDNDNGDISDDADDIDSPVASRQLSQLF